MQSTLGKPPSFTAIWQSDVAGKDWPGYEGLMRFFSPFISQHVSDGKHEVVTDNAILFDAWIYAFDPAYYAKFKGKNVFLVHIGDEFYDLGTAYYPNFRGVFRPYWSAVFNPQHVMVVPLGNHVANIPGSILRASERRYAWSFIGEGGKSSRPEMLRAMSSVEPHICFSTSPVRGHIFWSKDTDGPKRIPRQESVEILKQSAFAPAPMGNANLECYRLYEALDAGAIPIVEKRMFLDYFKELLGDHPIPTVRSWHHAREIVLRHLKDPVKLNELQKQCQDWWTSYQFRMVDRIGAFLSDRAAAGDQVNPLQSRLPSIPGWQYFELSRHQSAPAFFRRITGQISRIARQRQWRVSIRPGVPPT
jgi:hypothetical protein